MALTLQMIEVEMTSQDIKISLDDLKSSKNITELLDGDQLALIGSQVVNGYQIDEQSRAEWKEIVDKAMEIAKQTSEVKNTPWPNASNVKFPLIAQAAIQFAARVMPAIIQNERVVRARIVGKDEDGSKARRADRVSRFLSYELADESLDWEDGMDKLLQVLPTLGTVFKKTYYCMEEKRNISNLCVPDKIVVNYNTPSLEAARRVTHLIELSQNDIIEKQRRGIYDGSIDLESLKDCDGEDSMSDDEDQMIELLEQHCYLDLDGDGYKEPYIVVVHKASGKVLRISQRFKTIERNKKGEITKITPIQYFTDFHFIRSPDGGFYSTGFGSLLLPINKSINTLINQLIDSGTLANMQTGLIGRGLRIKGGEFQFSMGKYNIVNATDVAKHIFPLPTKEPSQTLFSLLGMLINVGKELSSSTDVLQGKEQAQNVAQGTINALVEQGTKVFTAINKRLYRSLKKEYQKIYELNSQYLKNDKYQTVLDDEEADVKTDFELDSLDIYPVADPMLSSEQQRMQKAMVMQQMPTADRRAVDMYTLETLGLEKSVIERLLPPPDPNAPPPPDAQLTLAKIQLTQAQIAEMSAKATLSAESTKLQQQKLAIQAATADAQVQESAARAWKMQKDASHGDAKVAIAAGKMQSQELLKGAEFSHKQEKENAELELKAIDISKKYSKEAKAPDQKSISEAAIEKTAKLKGMTKAQVRQIIKMRGMK